MLFLTELLPAQTLLFLQQYVLTDNKAFLTNYLILVLSGNNELHVHSLLSLPKLELKDNKYQNFGGITELLHRIPNYGSNLTIFCHYH